NAVDVLMAEGLTAAESKAFLESLNLEQRRLIEIALVDPMGDGFLEDAVLKTYERYYNDSLKKKEGKKNTDNALAGTGSSTAGGASGLPPDDDDSRNDSNKKSDIKMANDNYLKKKGFDAHKIKEEFFGKGSNSKYDIYIDKKSGELMLFRKGGLGDGIRTGYFIK
ncbi:polymorphic toxin type 33 domain-containing protein, partial [Gilliamella sp. Bif1-4]